jgi:glycosyltransferase involved in cell wall biosynthesis
VVDDRSLGDRRRPRLLVVGAFPPPGVEVFGGQVTACRVLLQSSLPKRVTLDLIDSTQISNPFPSLPKRALLAARRFMRFVHVLERRKPDAVLLFLTIGASLAEKGMMAWYARLRGIPALAFPRGGQLMDDSRVSAIDRVWLRVALGGARTLLCQSRTWQDFAVSVLAFSRVRAPVIPNWTATPELLAIGTVRRHRRDAAVRLLFLGWVDRVKGIGELLDTCRALAPTRRFTLDIVGEGDYSERGQAFVKQHGLSDVVRFRGWLSGAELHQQLANSDVLVLPSWYEGLPNAMIEAMAARLAVVVSAVGAIPGVVTDEQEALLIPPRDTPALIAAVSRVIDDDELRERLASAGFAVAKDRFSVEPAVARIIDAVVVATSQSAAEVEQI